MVRKSYFWFYRDYQFRSKAEALWAQFFDTLEIPFKYENETLKVDGGLYYLPDFWLPEQQVWIEIKNGALEDIEVTKAIKLFETTGKPVYILNGSPKLGVFLGPPSGAYIEEVSGFSTYFIDERNPEQLQKLSHLSRTECLMQIFNLYAIPPIPDSNFTPTKQDHISYWRINFNNAFKRPKYRAIAPIPAPKNMNPFTKEFSED